MMRRAATVRPSLKPISVDCMTGTLSCRPRLVHLLPRRMRVELIGWSGAAPEEVERRLTALPGVCRVHAHPRTRNALIHFDPAVTGAPAILRALAPEPAPDPAEDIVIAAYESARALSGSPQVAAAVAAGILEVGAFVLRHGRLLADLLRKPKDPGALLKFTAGLSELSCFCGVLPEKREFWTRLFTHFVSVGTHLLTRQPLGLSLALLDLILWGLPLLPSAASPA